MKIRVRERVGMEVRSVWCYEVQDQPDISPTPNSGPNTNPNIALTPAENNSTLKLAKRLAALVGETFNMLEPIQVVRYKHGQA